MLSAISYQLSASAIGYWLLAIGYWLLAIGYWLFAQRYLRPEVLIDSTNWRWKTKNSKSVGSATMADPAII
jgi:hypothetical protein